MGRECPVVWPAKGGQGHEAGPGIVMRRALVWPCGRAMIQDLEHSHEAVPWDWT